MYLFYNLNYTIPLFEIQYFFISFLSLLFMLPLACSILFPHEFCDFSFYFPSQDHINWDFEQILWGQGWGYIFLEWIYISSCWVPGKNYQPRINQLGYFSTRIISVISIPILMWQLTCGYNYDAHTFWFAPNNPN